MQLILLTVNLLEGGKEQKSTLSLNLASHSIHTHIHWTSYVTAVLN